LKWQAALGRTEDFRLKEKGEVCLGNRYGRKEKRECGRQCCSFLRKWSLGAGPVLRTVSDDQRPRTFKRIYASLLIHRFVL
jgi:hypothetical protein